jgi:hypothetical protein
MRHPFLLAALLPATAVAQSSAGDLAYCNRLADLHDHYIGRADRGPTRGNFPASLDGQVAAAQCRAGNPAGIPALERVLRGNGFSLPPR